MLKIVWFATALAGATFFVLSGQDMADARSYGYTGNKSCEHCHEKIYKSWRKSLHANAFDLLKAGARKKAKKEAGLKTDTDFSTDRSCMKCHALGFDAGGYSMESPDDNWKGIGCESCHGAAEKYLALHAKKNLKKRKRKLKQSGMKVPFKGKTVCGRCHTHRDSPFKFREEGRDRDWKDPKLAKTYHLPG